jgi:hypothetical protein
VCYQINVQEVIGMKKETCSHDYETCACDYKDECIALKQELDHIRRRLNEAEKIVCELTKENETLKVAYDEQYENLIRCEAQVEAFKFVISEGR